MTTSDHPVVQELDLELLDASPSNPRKTFNQEKLEELAASIIEHGVLEPVLARPSPTKKGRYEVVFGERRRRASKLARQATILAMVRELTDVEVLERQIVENKDREDIHPLEEAAGYQELHEKHHVAVKDIAAKLGKSTGYVYGRIALCRLEPGVAILYRNEALSHGAAVAIARVPGPLQAELVKELIPSWKSQEFQIQTEEAERHIRDRYMLKLAQAPFERGDAELVPHAGACTACPKRTGNQIELFADVKSPDVCTDPSCFAEKRDAQWERTRASADANGQKALSEKESKNLFHGSRLKHDSKYVDLAEENWTDSKHRKWSAILGKEKPPITLARDEHGDIHKLVSKEAAGLALKKAGGAAAKLAPDAKRSADPIAQRQRKESALRRSTADRAMALLVAAAEKKGATLEVVRIVVGGLVNEVWAERVKAVVERRTLAPLSKKRKTTLGNQRQEFDKVLLAAVKTMKLPALVGLAVELVASRDAYSVHGHYGGDALPLACKELGVNWGKCQAEAKAELAAKAPKKAKKKGRRG